LNAYVVSTFHQPRGAFRSDGDAMLAGRGFERNGNSHGGKVYRRTSRRQRNGGDAPAA
jgi:hypothetical protein